MTLATATAPATTTLPKPPTAVGTGLEPVPGSPEALLLLAGLGVLPASAGNVDPRFSTEAITTCIARLLEVKQQQDLLGAEQKELHEQLRLAHLRGDEGAPGQCAHLFQHAHIRALAKAEAERARLEQLRKELEKTAQRVKDLEAELSKKERAVRELKEAIAKALAGFEKLDIKVEYRNGKVYVILPEKLLFASGSIDVDPKGKEALIEIGKALNKQPDVQMAIEGHTDNIPMKGAIKDNWDLSVLRATSIARILISDAGMNPKRIQAVGRGDTQPVAGNDTPEGRAKNRRTEIVLTPQLDKILEILNN